MSMIHLLIHAVHLLATIAKIMRESRSVRLWGRDALGGIWNRAGEMRHAVTAWQSAAG
jgi:hypothetical protein